MGLFSSLKCRQCGSKRFNYRHPTGRPRCALCGTFAFGPDVARWRERWKRRGVAIFGLLLVAVVALWLLEDAGVLGLCPHPSIVFFCDLVARHGVL